MRFVYFLAGVLAAALVTATAFHLDGPDLDQSPEQASAAAQERAKHPNGYRIQKGQP